MNREITIGRDRNCDIVLDGNCSFASNYHATIFMDGFHLMYRDTSRNGTMINNVSVHMRAVPISYGDSIMLAGKYPLSWNVVNRYFPIKKDEPVHTSNVVLHGNEVYQEQPEFGWNWGAFSLYPLWGFWNGCWWAILVSFFFGWSIIPNIIFGAMGSKLAWENKDWQDAKAFNEMQRAWRPWGIAFFVLSIISFMILIFAFMSFFAALL